MTVGFIVVFNQGEFVLTSSEDTPIDLERGEGREREREERNIHVREKHR